MFSRMVGEYGPWFLRVCDTSLFKKKKKNTVGKGEKILLFPVFYTILENFLPFSSNLKVPSANSFGLEESKICRLGKG